MVGKKHAVSYFFQIIGRFVKGKWQVGLFTMGEHTFSRLSETSLGEKKFHYFFP